MALKLIEYLFAEYLGVSFPVNDVTRSANLISSTECTLCLCCHKNFEELCKNILSVSLKSDQRCTSEHNVIIIDRQLENDINFAALFVPFQYYNEKNKAFVLGCLPGTFEDSQKAYA